jgi:methyl-accepting chemotaxis protein
VVCDGAGGYGRPADISRGGAAMTLGISTRLYGIVCIFAAGLFALVSVLLYLEFDTLQSRRQQELKGLVDTAFSLMNAQYNLAQGGRISEAQAKARALEAIGSLRYQGDNYFWVNDQHPTMVMHPVRADLNGKDLTAIKDPNGKALFVEFVKAVENGGSGFVDYMWPKPGFDKPVEKISYVALFKPWGWIIGTGVYNDDIAAERHHALLAAGGTAGAIMLLVAGVAVMTARGISRRLKKLNGAMIELANGNFEVVLPDLDRNDEIGRIAAAVGTFKLKAVEKAKREADEIAAQQRRAAAEREEAMTKVAADFESAVGGIVKAAAAGDFSKRVALDGKTDLVLNVGGSINALCDNVAKALGELAAVLGALADGDLNRRIVAEYQGEFAALKSSANITAQRIGDTIAEIRQATREVANASAEISTSTTDLSQRTEQQAASLEQTSASMEQMSASVKKNAESAQQAAQSAKSTVAAAARGKEVVGKAVEAMARIAGSSSKITEIIGVIDEIARQTNLLALNAAVEAARAGDVGRGFAVVASEVRSLAQRASQAAKDIKDLIVNSGTRVQEGVDLVNAAGSSLSEIVESIKSFSEIVANIASASSEQSTGIDDINKALARMDEVTQQNSALVEQNAATAKALEQQASAMDERVAFFSVAAQAVDGDTVSALRPNEVQRAASHHRVAAGNRR